MNKNFVNFHILISHSPSCLNRDDMNMQKSAIFGGKRRVRVSSQSLKRTMRTSDYYRTVFPEQSIRTRQLSLLAEELFNQLNQNSEEIEKKWVEKAIQAFTSNSVDSEEDEAEIENDSSPDSDENAKKGKKVAVAPWSVSEFKVICNAVRRVYTDELSEKENEALQKALEKERARKVSKKKPRKSDEEVKDDFLLKKVKKVLENDAVALRAACGSAIDIALSGRMATSGLMTTIDGSLAVAHAITTHAVDADIDWFTAVDDLQELGSGHLDTQEFSSGVFYRYASLNLKQLQVNLGLLPDMKSAETAESRSKALDIAAHVLHMLATEVPSAKQQSFAAHNLADLALVSFSNQPISLANAFEKPVVAKGEGFRLPSITDLHKYWASVQKGYALDESCAEFLLAQTDVPEGIKVKASLPELEAWVRSDAK